MTAHLSSLTLHRLRYGDLPGDAAARARAHVGACASCAAMLRAQEHERADFVLRPVPEAIRQGTPAPSRPNLRSSSVWARWGFSFGGLAALAAAGLLALVPREHLDDPLAARSETRTRGELPAIEAWVDLGDGPRLLREGERLSPGDRVNLAYDPHGASAVAIAGRDSTGEIEVYSTNAPTGVGVVRAPFALSLDDTEGEQELFVITSAAPLDEAQVRAAVQDGAPDDDVSVARLIIEKAL